MFVTNKTPNEQRSVFVYKKVRQVVIFMSALNIAASVDLLGLKHEMAVTGLHLFNGGHFNHPITQ
jgi:hypothetical protein